jgi:hypothetical protein
LLNKQLTAAGQVQVGLTRLQRPTHRGRCKRKRKTQNSTQIERIRGTDFLDAKSSARGGRQTIPLGGSAGAHAAGYGVFRTFDPLSP